METQAVDDFLCLLGHTILLGEGEHGKLDGSKGSRQVQHGTCLTVGQLLLLVTVTHDGKEHAVHTDRGLDDVGSIALVTFRVEILNLLATILGMLAEVEVGAGVDTLHLLEAEGHVELDVGSGIGIVSQFVVVVETVVLCPEAQVLVPLHAGLLPLGEPVELCTGLDEELHLHLFELTHTEDELACYNLVAESLAYLGNAEGKLHAARLLHIEVVHEDTLCRFRTEIYLAGSLGCSTHLSTEHKVELAHVGPVTRTADGAYNLLVEDNLLHTLQVNAAFCVHHLLETLVQRITLLCQLQYLGRGGTILCLVEVLLETLARLLHLLVYLLIVLGHLVLDEHIGTIALLRVTVVDEGVVESIHMTGSLPGGGVHEDGGIDAHDVLVQQHHALPPVLLDVVLQFHTVLTIVIHGPESVIDIT